MNEAVTITPIYYFLMEFAKFVYAAFPLIIVLAGAGLVLQSIRTEPWGTSWYPPATYVGVFLVVSGFALMVIL
jgi:hypothetical protein